MIKAPLNLAMLGEPSAEQYCEILGLSEIFSPLTDPGCGEDYLPAAFERWYEAEMSLGEDATFTRSSTATVMMADGNVRDTKSGEARFVNCRRVENFVDNSVAPTTQASGVLEDFTDGVARFSGPSGSILFYGTSSDGGAILRPYSGHAQIRVLSSSAGRIQIDINDRTPSYIETDLLSDWTTVGIATAFRLNNPQYRFLKIHLLDADDIVVEVRNVQIEDVSGQSVTVPSEYVSLGTGDDHGANVDGVKYFNTTNGNTLVDGILTDLPGTRLTGDTGLLLEDTSRNFLINTDSFDLWTLTGATQSEDTLSFGPTGYPLQSLVRTGGATLHRLQLLRTPAQLMAPSNGDRAVISGFFKVTNAPDGVNFFFNSTAGIVAQLFIYEDQTVVLDIGDWFDYKVLDDGWVWVAVAGEFVDATLSHTLYVNDIAQADDDGTVFTEVAGLQLEIMTDTTRGTYASSYIPCESASVVRDAEKLQHHMAEPTHTNFSAVIRFESLADILGINRIFGTQDSRGTNGSELRGNTSVSSWNMTFDTAGGSVLYENRSVINATPGFNTYVFSGNQIDTSTIQARIFFNDVKVHDENETNVLDHSNLDIIETLSWEYTTEYKYHYPAICKYIAMYNQVMTDEELIQASEKASLATPPPVAPVEFYGLTYDPDTFELTSKISGIGEVNTIRVAPINVPDMNGVYHEIPGEQIAYPGARYENGVAYADDGTGTLLDPVPYALVAPEATNAVPYARNLLSWSINGTPPVSGARDIHGGDEAYTCTDIGSTNTWSFISIQPITSGVLSQLKFSLAKSGTAIAAVQLSTPTSIIQVDPSTGDWAFESGNQGGFSDVTINSVGDFWEVTVSFMPTSTSTMMYLNAARTLILGAGYNPAATGTNVFDAVGFYPNMTHEAGVNMQPIITNGAAALRDKDEVILNNLNLNAEKGSIYFEMIAGQDTTNLLDGFLSMTGGVVESDDGTNQASSAEVVVVGSASKVAMVWGASGMEQCTNGVWSSIVPYAGSLNDGVLDLFRNAEASNQMRDLQIWDTVEKTKINALMSS